MGAVFSTKGLKLMLENEGSTAIALVPTAITKAKPAEVTVANTLKDGDIVTAVDTGFEELDGRQFVVGSSTTSKFTLVGSDTTASTGTLKTAPKMTAVAAAEFTELCASEVSIDNNQPSTISVATFCDLYASVPSTVVDLGNATISMYHDITSAGFQLLEKASESGNKKTFFIKFPHNSGTFLIQGTVSSFAITDLPLDGAAAWQATLALSSKPRLVY